MSHVNEVIGVENMSSGGANPPRPLSHDSSGKGTTAKKRRYVVRLLQPRDSLPSSTPSSSSVSMPVRPLDVTPTPSSPPTKARPSSSHVNACGPSLAPTSTPSPSSVDAREPSPVPTSTPSPSLAVANMPRYEDATNLTPPPLNDHPMVTLINGAFHQSKVAAKAVTLSIRQQFGQPWSTWGRKLVWRPEEENEIKKAFNSKASHRLSEIFRDAQNENKRPYWIRDRDWNDMLSHWNAPEYRSKCAQTKKKIGHLKRVGVCTQVVLSACRITPFACQRSLVDLYM
ncbi:hypothetical protein GmHk_18G052061 [Glycine max]|nr:hypothetical protein GmHk_18G052061 [Glycine max]